MTASSCLPSVDWYLRGQRAPGPRRQPPAKSRVRSAPCSREKRTRINVVATVEKERGVGDVRHTLGWWVRGPCRSLGKNILDTRLGWCKGPGDKSTARSGGQGVANTGAGDEGGTGGV